MALSLRGGFIAEAIPKTVKGIASVAIASSQQQADLLFTDVAQVLHFLKFRLQGASCKFCERIFSFPLAKNFGL